MPRGKPVTDEERAAVRDVISRGLSCCQARAETGISEFRLRYIAGRLKIKFRHSGGHGQGIGHIPDTPWGSEPGETHDMAAAPDWRSPLSDLW